MPAVTAPHRRRRPGCRLRSRRLATIVAAALVMTAAPVISAPSASATVPNPQLNCQPETHPPAGTPRNSPGAPFQAPFAATLNGGFLAIHVPNKLGVTFGFPEPGYPNGTLFGEACGLLTLPSLKGPITDAHPGEPGNPAYNHNFILHGPIPGLAPPAPGFPVCDFRYRTATALNPTASGPGCNENQSVPVGLTLGGTGIAVLDGYGSADGVINTAILSAPAANGGFNVSFTNTAKATAVLDPAALLNMFTNLPASTLASLSGPLQSLLASLTGPLTQGANLVGTGGGECTLAVGDLSQTGLPGAPATPVVNLSTANPGGAPVTGPASAGTQAINPVTAGSAVASANDFAAPAIDPNMPPDPGAPGAGTMAPNALCNPVVAALFNTALGLPASPGNVTFRAPVGFSAHAPQ
ncbi:MAG: hypothetical protein M3Y91_09830 [Actinomycetota bacterium]|nr:hypothetical protein [Actinomycetota bacterium]